MGLVYWRYDDGLWKPPIWTVVPALSILSKAETITIAVYNHRTAEADIKDVPQANVSPRNLPDAFDWILRAAVKKHLEGLPLTEFRADGWPLCPRCGEDEVMSHLALPAIMAYHDSHGQNPPLQDYLNASLQCLYCGWSRPAKSQERRINV